jgi:hypothetical protein
VVHLGDLDAEARAQAPYGLRGELAQHLNAEAHVGGPEHRDLPGGLIQRRQIVDAGRAADERNALARGHARQLLERGRQGEVDDHVGAEQR